MSQVKIEHLDPITTNSSLQNTNDKINLRSLFNLFFQFKHPIWKLEHSLYNLDISYSLFVASHDTIQSCESLEKVWIQIRKKAIEMSAFYNNKHDINNNNNNNNTSINPSFSPLFDFPIHYPALQKFPFPFMYSSFLPAILLLQSTMLLYHNTKLERESKKQTGENFELELELKQNQQQQHNQNINKEQKHLGETKEEMKQKQEEEYYTVNYMNQIEELLQELEFSNLEHPKKFNSEISQRIDDFYQIASQYCLKKQTSLQNNNNNNNNNRFHCFLLSWVQQSSYLIYDTATQIWILVVLGLYPWPDRSAVQNYREISSQLSPLRVFSFPNWSFCGNAIQALIQFETGKTLDELDHTLIQTSFLYSL